ncbi:tetratricopeptide repeat protein [Hyalangium rubrum]|uniref:Tetratricopeptide repeat protein n=1 Tax=Hyalangium rubrum TaxID=3103134 RepID=A0ABU5HB90_9BACT|nr:tetratricopeptide repeat protein [Hyalangium sp. s54d21]MDY7230738.1 tetratricopeptide repeat protein [Hyalangium sp. s54d21]
MTQPTNWWPGLIALAISLLCGVAYLLLQRGKNRAAPAPEAQRDGVLDDLDRRAQSLIEQLKELVADKHNLSPEQFAAEKSRLELEAAAALRARDEYVKQRKSPAPGTSGSTAPAPTAPAPTGFAATHPQLMGALWGAAIVTFFGALGYLLVSEQRPRDEGMEATGRVPPGAEGAPGQPQGMSQEDQELAEAQERLKANPNDLESAALVAHEMIRRQSPEEAERLTNRTLALDPFHIESRVHRGVLRAIRGDVPGAEQELETLADTYPGAQEALLFLGFIHIQSGNRAKALAYFERFAVEVPRNMQPPQLEAAIAQLRQEVAGQQP